MAKIRKSDKIVQEVLGHRTVTEHLEITARKTEAGGSTFSLWYTTDYPREARVRLVADQPLRQVRAALERIRSANSLSEWIDWFDEPLFHPAFLNGHGHYWCPNCSGLTAGKVAVSDSGNLLLQDEEGDEPQRGGNIAILCNCVPEEELKVKTLIPRYGYILGKAEFHGAPIVVRWDGESWRRGGTDQRVVQDPVRELGRLRLTEAKARAEAGSYCYRTRGWGNDLTGPEVIPSHAANDKDTPLGEFESRQAAFAAAHKKAWDTLPSEGDIANELSDKTLATSYGRHKTPHGRLTRIAQALESRAIPYSIPRGDTGGTSYENWVFVFQGEYFLAEEHHNGWANTCCSKVELADRDTAVARLRKHSWPHLNEEAIQAALNQ